MKICQELAVEKMALKRDDRKRWNEIDTVEWTFKTSDKILVLALIKTVNWTGPETTERQIFYYIIFY